MSYKQIKLIDYVHDPEMPSHINAKGRKAHYESEILRIQAAELIQKYKEAGKPIMVQGQQDD